MNDENRQMPVSWEDELAKQAQEVSALERPQVAQITLRAGIMAYAGTPIPNNALNCVIVAATFERAVYPKFDPTVIAPPLCFAQSLDGQNMRPSEVVSKPFNDICETCENNQWVAEEGRRRKRCKEVRKLALLSYMADGNYEEADLAVIRIPTMSVIAPKTGWSSYINQVAATVKRPYYAVLTEIKVAPDMKTQFKVHFSFLGKLEQDAVIAIQARREFAERILMTPYDLTQPEPVKGNVKF